LAIFLYLAKSVFVKIHIQTERLILRELLPEDETGMFELDSSAEVHRYLGNQPFTRIEESREIIHFIRKQYQEWGIGRWAVENKESGEFMGWAGLKFVRDLTNNHIHYYDIGYRFIPRFWGKGFATEVAKACVNYGFEHLNVKEIFAMADINNAASLRVLEKSGLQFVENFDFMGDEHAWYKISSE
jgi:ribosomal-protein-alanine N-acetyltransferase